MDREPDRESEGEPAPQCPADRRRLMDRDRDREPDRVSLYRKFGNPTLLGVVERILPSDGAVLDVGCASGGLLHQLRDHAGRRVGVEISEAAAHEAALVADEVVNRGIDDLDLNFPDETFDVVVCGDVLEHLVAPDAALARITRWLAPGGAVVVSVPNIANWQSRLRLLRGTWRYESCGIWDRTHLRFFTLATLQELMEGAGLSVESIDTTQDVAHQIRALAYTPKFFRRWLEAILQMLARRRPQLFALQLICVGRPSS